VVKSDRKTYDFRKDERIRIKRDFEKVYSCGKRSRNHYFVLICHKNNLDKQRVATVVGRKYGKAHERNQIKRRMREIFRLNREKFPPFSDCIIIPQKAVLTLSFKEIREHFLLLMERCHI